MTLVELMVGLALGLVITVALLVLFANASANGQNVARAGMQIENGRYVAELLREDLQMAGFYGETAVSGALYEAPDPCATTPTGWSGTTFTLPAPVKGYLASDELACLSNRKPDTAAVALRYLGVTKVAPSSLAAGNKQYYVQYSFCTDDTTAPRLIFTKEKTELTMRDRACSATNTARPYLSRIYYIASCNRCGNGGDDTPTLKRVDLIGDELVTTAIADGVDNLQLEYGFDTDGNGSADSYLTTTGDTGPTASWENVMAVKLHFITRSPDKVSGSSATAQQFELGGIGTIETPADQHTRKVYTSVVRLINPSSAREAQ